jgi:hypothetical protein
LGYWLDDDCRQEVGYGEVVGAEEVAQLADWGLRDDTLLVFVGPVVPAVGPGSELRSGGGRSATVGLPVTVQPDLGSPGTSCDGFLTVAHGVGRTGSRVLVHRGARDPVLGEVVHHDDSARGTAGGDDIAVVALSPGHHLSGWLRNRGTKSSPSGPPYPAEDVDLYGARSSKVLGQAVGTLLQVGDLTWQWLDCWDLGGTIPGLQYGDSGALAVEPGSQPSVFGHFVGGTVARGGQGFSHHFVQDLGQLLARQGSLAQRVRF